MAILNEVRGELPRGMVGLVGVDGKFKCVHCASKEELKKVEVLSDDDSEIILVMEGDDWKNDVGECQGCNKLPDEVRTPR